MGVFLLSLDERTTQIDTIIGAEFMTVLVHYFVKFQSPAPPPRKGTALGLPLSVSTREAEPRLNSQLHFRAKIPV